MKFFKIPKLHFNSKECQENIFRKFYSLFFILPLVLFFVSFVFNFFSWGVVFEWFLCFGFLEPI
ncbi:hypothetical protein E5K72_07160 [Helicobacter pylori]|nr:hypothetical protein E5K72_07160 [Helicobacter pylori]